MFIKTSLKERIRYFIMFFCMKICTINYSNMHSVLWDRITTFINNYHSLVINDLGGYNRSTYIMADWRIFINFHTIFFYMLFQSILYHIPPICLFLMFSPASFERILCPFDRYDRYLSIPPPLSIFSFSDALLQTLVLFISFIFYIFISLCQSN